MIRTRSGYGCFFNRVAAGCNSAGGINNGTDPRIGSPNQIKTVLNRPEDRHGQMLIGRRCPAEPGIIGDIHEEVRPLFRCMPGPLPVGCPHNRS